MLKHASAIIAAAILTAAPLVRAQVNVEIMPDQQAYQARTDARIRNWVHEDNHEVSEEERNEMLPSGGQQKLFNRVGWARTYMVKAGLLESSGRGKFKITDRGLAALKKKPAKGVFITTSQFSADAKDYVNRIEKKIILIDGEQLANLSIEFGIGVAPVISYKIQRIDLDYFEEE